MSSTTRSTGCAVEPPQRLLAVGRLDDRVAVLLEREREHLADGVLVVDEQDRGGVDSGIVGSACCQDSPRDGGGPDLPHGAAAPRRGSLERPVNGGLYRARSLVARAAARCSSRSASRGRRRCPRPLLPPNFDGAATRALAADLSTQLPGPRHRAGRARCAPRSGSATSSRQYGLHGQRRDTWTQRVPGLGRVRLRNLWAVAPGQSREAIVVMAHRDDTGAGPGANDNASGTAALVELARGYARAGTAQRTRVRSAHTIVFLSTDGGAFGGLGAARFAAHSAVPRSSRRSTSTRSPGAGAPRIEIAGDEPRSPAALARRDRGAPRPRADRLGAGAPASSAS